MFHLHRWIPDWTPLICGVEEEYGYVNQQSSTEYKVHFHQGRYDPIYNQNGFVYTINESGLNIYNGFMSLESFQADRVSEMEKVRNILSEQTGWVKIDPIPFEDDPYATYLKRKEEISRLSKKILLDGFSSRNPDKIYYALLEYDKETHELFYDKCNGDLDTVKFLHEMTTRFSHDKKFCSTVLTKISSSIIKLIRVATDVNQIENSEVFAYVKSTDMMPSPYSIIHSLTSRCVGTTDEDGGSSVKFRSGNGKDFVLLEKIKYFVNILIENISKGVEDQDVFLMNFIIDDVMTTNDIEILKVILTIPNIDLMTQKSSIFTLAARFGHFDLLRTVLEHSSIDLNRDMTVEWPDVDALKLRPSESKEVRLGDAIRLASYEKYYGRDNKNFLKWLKTKFQTDSDCKFNTCVSTNEDDWFDLSQYKGKIPYKGI
jgi:hypothetical protein